MQRGRGSWMMVVVVGLLAAGACRFVPGKPLSWTSTIETQFPIETGEDREIGYWHFDDAFEINPGKVSLKLNYRADQAQGALSPTGITWRLRVFDPSFQTTKFQYDLNTTGKMKQLGCCAYRVSFKGSDPAFAGWNIAAGDSISWSIVPQGGTLPSGVDMGIKYVYTPN